MSGEEELIACNKGGAHAGRFAEYLCTRKSCQSVDLLLCEICRDQAHKNHPVIKTKEFFSQLRHRVDRQRINDYVCIGSIIQESERVCSESLANLKAHLIKKFQKIETSLVKTFGTWREHASLFEEHHSIAVIRDLKQMESESDISILSQQLRKVLAHIRFVDELPKDKYTQQSSRIKSISKQLLGLPPVSKEEVHCFQQAFLTSLKKISDVMATQYLSAASLNPPNDHNCSFISQLNQNSNNSSTAFLEGSSSFAPKASVNENLEKSSSKNFLNSQGKYLAKDLIAHYEGRNKRFSTSSWISQKTNGTLAAEPIANIQGIEDVQHQINGLQKYLDKMRNSIRSSNTDNPENINTPSRLSIVTPPMRPHSHATVTESNFFQSPTLSRDCATPKSDFATGFHVQPAFRTNSLHQSGYLQSDKNPFGKQVPKYSEKKSSCSLNGIMNPPQQFLQMEQESKQMTEGPFSQDISFSSNTHARQQTALNFSEKFQKFRENSKSLSREKSLNNSYQRYIYDSSIQPNISKGNEEKDEEETGEQSRKSSVNLKKVKFQFSKSLKHEFINVSKFTASSQKESFSTRLILLEPTVEIIPHREITFTFLIKSCRELEYGQPLAIGLCHKDFVHDRNYEFPQKEERIQRESRTTDISNQHGCYLLTSTGFLRNHAYAKQDLKKVPVRFSTNDVIVCHFNPFKKTLQFTKKSTGEMCTLNTNMLPNDKLYPCVRISYPQDSVEYIHE